MDGVHAVTIQMNVNGTVADAKGVYVKVAGEWLQVASAGGGAGTPTSPTLTVDADKTKITWLPVEGTAGPTLGYGYTVKPLEGIACTLAGTTLTIDSVTEDIEFTFNVWGVNTNGRGESSSTKITWTGLDAPVITGAQAPAGITASWVKVSGATSYLVSWKKKSETIWQAQNVGDVNTFTVSKLAEQVPYEVKVASVKLNVTSPYSNVVEVTPGPNLPPAAPFLRYSAEGQFTIDNYSGGLIYSVSGASRSGNILSGVSNGATITAEYGDGSPKSKSSTMNVLANARVLTDSIPSTTTGCGPRGDICCPDGRILDTSGRACGGSPGSLAPNNFCSDLGTPCDGNCYQLTVTCYNWYWTNYSGDGYTLIGQTWGRALNG